MRVEDIRLIGSSHRYLPALRLRWRSDRRQLSCTGASQALDKNLISFMSENANFAHTDADAAKNPAGKPSEPVRQRTLQEQQEKFSVT
eukprot:750082-Hanusia_phi.AAC.3